MADEPHDDADASQPGDPESSSDHGEITDEHDAVATGFEVDDDEPQDFDAETGEYDADPDEIMIENDDGDEPGDEFVIDEESPEETAPESEQPAEADDIEDQFQDEPVPDNAVHDGGALADEESAEQRQESPAEPPDEEPDLVEFEDERVQVTDESDFADESGASNDAGSTGELEFDGDANGDKSDAEAGAPTDDPEAADDTPEDQTLGDEETDSDATDESPLQPELESILDAPEPEPVDVEPLPEVGPYRDPATLTLWIAGDQQETFAIAHEELVIGADSSAEAEDDDAASEVTPDIDLGPYVDSDAVWRRHAALYRHNKNYTLYTISDGATQLNDEILELGEHRRLEDGDVVVIGGEVAFEFELPDTEAGNGQSASR